MFYMRKVIQLIVIFSSLFGLHILNNKINLPVKNHQTKIYLSPHFKHLTMGFNKFFSSAMWINTLLDTDLSHYEGSDLKSWMYLRFNAMTDLDPHFLEAYRFGSLYLSVVKDDILGATKLFQKGLGYFPNDYKLNLYGAYHSLYENKDEKTAINRLSRIRTKLTRSPFVLAILYSLRAKEVSSSEELESTVVKKIQEDPLIEDVLKERLIEKIRERFLVPSPSK